MVKKQKMHYLKLFVCMTVAIPRSAEAAPTSNKVKITNCIMALLARSQYTVSQYIRHLYQESQ